MNLKNLFQNTFSNPGLVPYKSDRFILKFYSDTIKINEQYVSLESTMDLGINVQLPSVEYKTVTRKWFGGTKTDRIITSYEGTSTINFLYRPNTNNNLFLNFFSLNDINGFRPANYPNTAFNRIEIYIIPSRMTETIPCYTLYNCIVTKVSLPELNYENEDFLKFSLDIHYDYWNVSEKSGEI